MKADAPLLAELVNYAGEGLPLYLWENIFSESGLTGWQVGCERAERVTGSFSYSNSTLVEWNKKAAGCLIGYDIPEKAEPIPDDLPDIFRPLQELENLALSTWYINVLAVLPAYRNKGLGTELLKLADETAKNRNQKAVSLIVSDANTSARRLYERNGFQAESSRKMVKEAWQNDGQNWILLTKSV